MTSPQRFWGLDAFFTFDFGIVLLYLFLLWFASQNHVLLWMHDCKMQTCHHMRLPPPQWTVHVKSSWFDSSVHVFRTEFYCWTIYHSLGLNPSRPGFHGYISAAIAATNVTLTFILHSEMKHWLWLVVLYQVANQHKHVSFVNVSKKSPYQILKYIITELQNMLNY